MTQQEFFEEVQNIVSGYANKKTDATDNVKPLEPDDVYIVWSCKTLQNWKALASTPRPDGMYYEITFNGDKNEIYLDAYKKFENWVFPLQ